MNTSLYSDFFDRDYFENGRSSGKSYYENHHWIPERSFTEAHWFIREMNVLPFYSIIDFGCAKGFLVKALRILGYDAWGEDISDYAISNAEDGYGKYLAHDFFGKSFSFGFCKDTLEHCRDGEELREVLLKLKSYSDSWLIIVPTAENGRYLIPEYEMDKSHFIRFDRNQWIAAIEESGLSISKTQNEMRGFKEHWTSKYANGNLFMVTK